MRHRLFNEDRINQHETVLHQLEAEGRDLLLRATIRGKEALTGHCQLVERSAWVLPRRPWATTGGVRRHDVPPSAGMG